ncbi:Reticulocyte-binding protein 2-like a [Stylophora pistillata]|uniref:Reticulocyte-binding protein 2-like a n=1 Tax=Stylophora pistillata TaxID=50429 RepID=A0A2B4R611_STYPI|nr:Reticulocyte-binding protein 2-like a [Stylophora pistillata]
MPEVQIPDVLKNLESKGVKFTGVPFMNSPRASIVEDRSVYFSIDTIVTSQVILEAFDAAGIDIDTITCIQRKTSNKSWIVSFTTRAAKEAALDVSHMEICGLKVFLGDCENRLILVKIYEAPAELPDTALIGRLSHYGQLLSFRRDKIAQHIHNGVRTARMSINRAIPSVISVAAKTEEDKKQEREERARRAKEQREKEEKRKQEQQQQQRQQQKQQRQQQERQQQQKKNEDRNRESTRGNEDEKRRDQGKREERRDERRDERDERRRDRDDREYYRRDDRDRSSCRDYSDSETDDGWHRVRYKRRRHEQRTGYNSPE